MLISWEDPVKQDAGQLTAIERIREPSIKTKELRYSLGRVIFARMYYRECITLFNEKRNEIYHLITRMCHYVKVIKTCRRNYD